MKIKPTFKIEGEGVELCQVRFCFNDIPDKFLAEVEEDIMELPDNWNLHIGGHNQWGIEWEDSTIYWPEMKWWKESVYRKEHFDVTHCSDKEVALDLVKRTKKALEAAWIEVKKCNAS